MTSRTCIRLGAQQAPFRGNSRTPNESIIHRFNRGEVGINDVLRVTTACIRKLGNDYEHAIACLEALQRCRHPRTGEGVSPDIVNYNATISACAKAARADEALKLFAHLQQHGATRGAFPDTITYSAAISACEKATRADDALRLFDDLLLHGPRHDVFPNTITYSAAISACEKAARADDALRLFDHLLQHGPERRVFPDTICYSAVISACEKAARANDALRLFDHLLQHGPARGILPDAITYNAVISTCDKADRQSDISRLLDDGIKRGIFQSPLGFDADRNRLDLHEIAILTSPTRSDDPAGVHPAVARAIFGRLLKQGVIGESTSFVVGQHGHGSLRTALAACMEQQGWPPTHPYDAQGHPNRGVLVADRALVDAGVTENAPGGHQTQAPVLEPNAVRHSGNDDIRTPLPIDVRRIRQVP
ncbi:hypothetical protein [Paraburkholderia humisilvae]